MGIAAGTDKMFPVFYRGEGVFYLEGSLLQKIRNVQSLNKAVVMVPCIHGIHRNKGCYRRRIFHIPGIILIIGGAYGCSVIPNLCACKAFLEQEQAVFAVHITGKREIVTAYRAQSRKSAAVSRKQGVSHIPQATADGKA